MTEEKLSSMEAGNNRGKGSQRERKEGTREIGCVGTKKGEKEKSIKEMETSRGSRGKKGRGRRGGRKGDEGSHSFERADGFPGRQPL